MNTLLLPARAYALLLSFAVTPCLMAAGTAVVPSLEPDTAGNLALRWSGTVGKFYRIEQSSDLVHWKAVPGQYSGGGAPHAPVVRAAGDAPTAQGFWRVIEADRSFFTLSYPTFPIVTVGAPIAALPATVTFPDSRFPLTYSVVSGALPSGLSLNLATGEITGVPSSLAPYRVQIRASNGALTALTTLSGIPNVITQPSIDQYRCPAPTAQYYVDSVNGLDANDGSAPTKAWRTLAKINALTLQPGNVVNLARGSLWTQQLTLKHSGTAAAPIVVQAYGSGAAPTIQRNTTPSDLSNAVKISGSHIRVLDLRLTEVHWSAVHLEPSAQYVVVAGNEISQSGCGIDLLGKHNKAIANHIHDMTMVVDDGTDENTWGANGLGVFGEDLEVAWNRLVNCRAPSQAFGGYDGGAIEFFGRTETAGWNVVGDDIRIHHNLVDGCDGFLEASGRMTRLVIAYNVVVNIPAGVFLFHMKRNDAHLTSYDVRIENNTIVGGRTVFAFYGAVANFAPTNKVAVRNNLVACTNHVGWQIVDIKPYLTHDHNLFYFVRSKDGTTMGNLGDWPGSAHKWELTPTERTTTADPGFVNYAGNDARLKATSSAVDAGVATAVLDGTDLLGTPVPSRGAVDLGAYECP